MRNKQRKLARIKKAESELQEFKFLIAKGGFKGPALEVLANCHHHEFGEKTMAKSMQKIRIEDNPYAEMVDRISNLPNDILVYILSFVPIENAVATSILSKKWRHVWTGIRALDMTGWRCSRNSRPECRHISFDNWLRMLDVLDVACLDLVRCHFDIVDATRSLASLMKRRMYKLDLVSKSIDMYATMLPLTLPLTLFACENLVELKLYGRFTILFPSSLHCPNLKVLSLVEVDFGDGGSAEDLIRGCPVLEELYYIDNRRNNNFAVCSSSLKILQYDSWRYQSSKIDTPNLEHLHLTARPIEEIGAPNLRCLKLDRIDFGTKFPLKDMFTVCPVVEELYINDCGHYYYNLKPVYVVCSSSLKILQHGHRSFCAKKRFKIDTPNLEHLCLECVKILELRAPNLRHLKLSDFDLSDGLEIEEMPFIVEACLDPSKDLVGLKLRKMPVFMNLTHLKVEMMKRTVLFDLLELTPVLKSLTMTHEIHDWWRLEDYWHRRRYAPKCFGTLEQVTFHNYKGDKYGQSLIKYFLRKAKLLKKMGVTLYQKCSIKSDAVHALYKMTKLAFPSCELIHADGIRQFIMYPES